MDVAGLLFDMDDVLYDDSLWRRWLIQLLTRIGLHADYRTFFRVWQREQLNDVNCGRLDFWESLRTHLTSAGLSSGQSDEVLAAVQARRRRQLESIRPFPGVLSTTAKLNSIGIPLGILCDSPWQGDRIDRMLQRLGMPGRFSPVLCSVELGSTKPAAFGYQTALQQMRLDAGRVAFVGHDTDELAGAKAIGMQTIAFNHDDDARADLYLEHFDQLLGRLNFQTQRPLAG